MKRNFYNNMMKKLLVSLSLVVMLFAYVVPLKSFATTTTAKDLYDLITWDDGLNRTVSESTCQTIIDTVINSDKVNNKIETTKKDGNITKITFSVTDTDVVSTAFANVAPGEINGDDIAQNAYNWAGIYVVKIAADKGDDQSEGTTPVTNPDSTGKSDKPQSVERDATAQDLFDVIKYSEEVGGVSIEQCEDVIDDIKDEDPQNNKVICIETSEEINNKTIIFRVTSSDHVKNALDNNITSPEKYGTGLLTGGGYGYLKIEIIGAEEYEKYHDQLTEDEQKIFDKLMAKYGNQGLDPEEGIEVVKKGYYYIDEQGDIWVDRVKAPDDYFDEIGLVDGATRDDYNKGDLGGWLLEPVFMLVNFVFDSLTSVLGRVMNNNEDGLLYTKTEPTIDTSTLTDKDIVRVNTEPFGVVNHFTINYTPEEIFSGKIDLLSIDFISGTKADGTAVTNEGWINIRTVIAQWYKVLRMIAIIGLLSVLIYTGIKIIISANAKDKAKYKEWIINWFIAVAILFTMHYLMAFITSITGEFSNLLSEANGKVIVEEVSTEEELNKSTIDTAKLFETNLMGLVRFRIQGDNMVDKIAYEVMYIALFIYTVKFTFVYLKRVLNMAFLTLIAPIVALTYPIDKLNDGNAQGFNMWLKEYIFNALLQPMHLVLYYILLGSAIGVAANNPLYGIVVLAFMTQAEDLLKKIFGYNKAGVTTANGMTGAFAAGALAAGVKNVARLAGKGSGGGNADKTGGSNPALDKPKPTEKNDKDMELFDDPVNESEHQDSNENNDDNNNDNKSAEEKMFEADEENGVFDDDPEYRENLQRGNNQQNNNNYSDEETREMLRNQGWSEEEINDTLNPTKDTEDQQTQQENEQQTQQENLQESNTDPIDKLAEEQEQRRKERQERRKKIANGAKAVGKRLAKPVWEFGKGGKYNGKRLARKVGRAAVGAAIGITAAAVQAGISITDGKYSAKEGLLTFAAGYAGGGKVASSIGSIGTTFMEAYNAGDKEAAMKRAQERWGSRDDVIKHNQQKWPSPEKRAEMEKRQRENYLPQGINDLSKMDKCMNYVDKISEEARNKNLTQKQLDTKARVVSDFMDDLEAQGMKSAIRDADKRKKYIETITRGLEGEEKIKTANRYNNLFIEAAKFQEANRNL